MTLTITVPAGNDRGPIHAEQLLDALLRGSARRARLRLEIERRGDEVVLAATLPDWLSATFRQQCRASYPDCRLTGSEPMKRSRVVRRRLRPVPHDGTVRGWREFHDEQRTFADPLVGVLAATADRRRTARIVLAVQTGRSWTQWLRRRPRIVDRHPVALFVEVERGPRVIRRLDELTAALGRFAVDGTLFAWNPWPWRRPRLTTAQIVTLWHPPTAEARTERLAVSRWRELEPPPVLPSPRCERDLAVLGRVVYRNRREPFGLRPDDRLRHLFLVGKTGMGKSTLLRNLVLGDVVAGRGCGLIDPHGDLAESVLAAIPAKRRRHVVSFDAGDRANPPRFNPLACGSPEQRPLVAAGVVAALRKIHADSWGPRLEHVLRNALLALLEVPGSTLAGLQRILVDAPFRRSVLPRLSDPVVRGFWIDEFGRWNERFRAEAIAPVQNKLGAFLANPILRSIVDAPCGLDLRSVMDDGRHLIVNLSKGRVGEDGSALLGALLVNAIQLAAMARADRPEQDRRPFHLHVDEFQNVATEAFGTILSEARKYGLGLVVANQFLEQIDETTLAALLGNVGSIVAFQVGPRDAATLAEQLGPDVELQDLLDVPKYHAHVRLLVDGLPSRAFSMGTVRSRM